MKIVAVESTIVRLPEVKPIGDGCQTLLLLEVVTDEGIVGLGEVHTNPLVSRAVLDAPMCARFARGIRELLIGENPLEIARLWDKMSLFTTTFGRHGAATHVQSGVDIALWDILGKALKQPVHQLIGGKRRDSIACYASDLWPEDSVGLVDQALRHRAAGYQAIKLGWGPLSDGRKVDIQKLVLLREALGPDIDLMIDVGMPLPFRDALAFCRELEHVGVYFLEEPLGPEDFRGYAKLVALSPVEIASGEKLDSIEQYVNLMELGDLRIIQPDITRAGGITGCLRIVANAEARGVTVIPHCWSCDILVAATLQLVATMPSCPYLEFNVMNQPLRRNIISEPFLPTAGILEIPSRPGLGVELNRELIRRYRWDP